MSGNFSLVRAVRVQGSGRKRHRGLARVVVPRTGAGRPVCTPCCRYTLPIVAVRRRCTGRSTGREVGGFLADTTTCSATGCARNGQLPLPRCPVTLAVVVQRAYVRTSAECTPMRYTSVRAEQRGRTSRVQEVRYRPEACLCWPRDIRDIL